MFADNFLQAANNMKKLIVYFLISLCIIQHITVLPGCANIIPPGGGPVDSTAPELVEANPPNLSKNFKGKQVTFTFDEFVEVQNLTENLVVSPTPIILPRVDYKLHTVTLRLKDTLEENTTYAINFGNAIRDVHEGNPIKNLTYIFSTGETIDSLELKGRVVLAESGKTDSTMIALLHKKGDDSAVVNERPRYIAKLDGKGNFNFRNLPAGTFYLYAMKDEGGSHRYQSPAQLFAFSDSAVVVGETTRTITLYAYREKELAATIPSAQARTASQDKRLRFSTNLTNNKQDLMGNFVMIFETPIKSFDTAHLHFSSDTSFIPISNYSLFLDSTKKKLQLTYPWKENTIYHFIMDKDFAVDTLGRKLLKTDTLIISTRRKADYGTVRIHIRNIDLTKHPVLLFYQNDALVSSAPLAQGEFYQPLFQPGDYELRILYDRNNNGKWDPGEFFGKHKQPEIVIPIEKKIAIKPNWENDFERSL
jgi:Bacterial Ig-like domain